MGVPMGIGRIDDAFGGWQPGMLVTFLGRQKALKTTVLLNSVWQAYEAGWSSLVYSVEMNKEVLRQRLYAIAAHVDPDRIRRGTLTPSDKDLIRRAHKGVMADQDDVDIMLSKRSALFTIDDIEFQVRKYQPNVVYVDGVYFMRDRITGDACTEPRAADNVSRELKSLAMASRIPVVVTTQVREKQHRGKLIEGRTMRDGTGLLQDSDLVLGMNRNPGEHDVSINEVVNRWGSIDPVTLDWNWSDMTFRIREDDDLPDHEIAGI